MREKRQTIKNTVYLALLLAMLLAGALLGIFLPKAERSVPERRRLASMPQLSAKSVEDGSFMRDYETYTQDHFPARETFRRIKALFCKDILQQLQVNEIAVKGGTAVKLDYPLQPQSVQHATERFSYLWQRYLRDSDCTVYTAVVPDKNYYAAPIYGYPQMEYACLFSMIEQQMPYAKRIDLTDTLCLESYYRTDAHWRADALQGTAQRIAQAMGAQLALEALAPRTLPEPFYGVYSGQTALPLGNDALTVLDGAPIQSMRVYDLESDSYGTVYDESRRGGADLYEYFLSGSRSFLRIENDAAQTDRELIIFRDSFGSAIAPLLATGYRTVTLVDIRYLSPALLGRYQSFSDQDVLFLYSASVLNHSETLK